MMGLLERADRSVGQAFVADDDVVMLIGEGGRLDAGEYLGRTEGAPEPVDLPREVAAIELVIRAAEGGLLRSAHDVAGGGLAVALAESAIAGGRGARVTLAPGRRDDEVLFGEGGGRFVITVRPEDVEVLEALTADLPVPVTRIGVVAGDTLEVTIGDTAVSLDVEAAREAHERALPEALA
jgi:phosphoribosylformylglycinamidine synthase